MSELKVYKISGIEFDSQFYHKSEADKVIAELKEKYKELAKLHDKAIQACCDADKVLAEKDKEIAELKEQQRWHKFPAEWPPKDMIGEEFIVSNGNYSKIAEWDEGYWENEPFCGSKVCDEVVKWKYLD